MNRSAEGGIVGTNRLVEGEDRRVEGSYRSKLVKVYYGEISSLLDEENFNRNLSLVNERRRKKVLNCRQPMDRCRALGAGLLLRQGLIREGLCYEELAFEAEEKGRLFLPEYPELSFNLSHSGNYAVAAFARDDAVASKTRDRLAGERIGVDIEDLESRFSGRNLRRIADRISTEREKAYLEGVREEEYVSEFARIWTRKEAYAKAVGLGLGMDFARVDVLGEDFAVSRKVDGRDWISVCRVDREGNPLKIHEVAWEKIVF